MLKKYLGCLTLVPALALAGESGGVSEINYGVGLAYSDYLNLDLSQLHAGAQLNLPVYKYIGSTIGIVATQTDGHGDFFDSDTYQVKGTVFLRDFDLGKIGIGAGYGKTKFDSMDGFSIDDSTLNTYEVLGEYYINDFTIGANHMLVDNSDFDNSNATNLDTSWYWQDNTKFSLGVGIADGDESYSISAAHQLAIFNNSTEISIAYAAELDDNDFDTVSLSFNYYFGTKVSLVNRDRKYR